MFFLDFPQLISEFEFLQNINGEDNFFESREEILKPLFNELMANTALKLNKANLKGKYLLRAKVIVHVQKRE